jgi:hypothetical protein
MLSEVLGRDINVLAVADDVYVPLKDCSGVAFIGFNAAGDTWTLTEAKSAAGASSQVLATIERFHTQVTPGAAWVKGTQAAGSAVTTTGSQDVICIEVLAPELSDGYTHLKLTSTSTGTVVAIQHGLKVGRAPNNLPALV